MPLYKINLFLTALIIFLFFYINSAENSEFKEISENIYYFTLGMYFRNLIGCARGEDTK